jgi:hypothetical protein
MKFFCLFLLSCALFNVQVFMKSIDTKEYFDEVNDELNLDEAQNDEMFENFGGQLGQLAELPNMFMGLASNFGG